MNSIADAIAIPFMSSWTGIFKRLKQDPTFVATACGRHFASDLIHRRNDLSLDSNQVLCTHPGCRKGWQATGALG